MTQRTYYEEDGPVWDWWSTRRLEVSFDPEGIVVRYGYTFRQLRQAAHMALRRSFGTSMNRAERYEIAFAGVVTALYEADEPPSFNNLVAAGSSAATRYQGAENRYRGLGPDYQRHPRFNVFWDWHVGPVPSPEKATVERFALRQILPLLPERERECLMALAVHRERRRAAEALGYTQTTFQRHLITARRLFLEQWWGDETPRPMKERVVRQRPQPIHCAQGHEWTPETTRLKRQSGGGSARACRLCDADYRNRSK